jgi:hypothetical protein
LFLVPHLTPENIERIHVLLTPPFTGRNLEQVETEYQEIVQRQTFADMKLLYAPENAAHVSVTYPAFHPSDGKPGKDRGFGLHVVKRLTLPLGEGKTKIIYVNEQWPEDREGDGGLFFPDEIRIQTLVFEGPRHVPGSEKLYLFDSIRLAWGQVREIEIARRTRYAYDEETGHNRLKLMRVPVSAPLSCIGCHHSPSPLVKDFLGAGEAVNHEAIVQDGYFDRPLDETRGFRDYMSYLAKRRAPEKFVDRVRAALLDPAKSMEVPGIEAALARSAGAFSWLPADSGLPYGEDPLLWRNRQGVYQSSSGDWLVDATEDTFEGKYRYWFPEVAVPRP